MSCNYNALISYRLHSFSCLRCCFNTQASIERQMLVHESEKYYIFLV